MLAQLEFKWNKTFCAEPAKQTEFYTI